MACSWFSGTLKSQLYSWIATQCQYNSGVLIDLETIAIGRQHSVGRCKRVGDDDSVCRLLWNACNRECLKLNGEENLKSKIQKIESVWFSHYRLVPSTQGRVPYRNYSYVCEFSLPTFGRRGIVSPCVTFEELADVCRIVHNDDYGAVFDTNDTARLIMRHESIAVWLITFNNNWKSTRYYVRLSIFF